MPLSLKEFWTVDMTSILEPGMLVRHPSQDDWGVGQVQSNINGKVTVNFRETGKIVIDGARVMLILVQNCDLTT
ncbi:MAG: hypothetical protein ACI82I_003340 [Gammaproteobacteria bacterium]|jgi:hypothetical protein